VGEARKGSKSLLQEEESSAPLKKNSKMAAGARFGNVHFRGESASNSDPVVRKKEKGIHFQKRPTECFKSALRG